MATLGGFLILFCLLFAGACIVAVAVGLLGTIITAWGNVEEDGKSAVQLLGFGTLGLFLMWAVWFIARLQTGDLA